MALAILDQLQSPELNPQSTFTGASEDLKDTKGKIKDNLGEVNLGDITKEADSITKTFADATSGLKNGKGLDTNVLQSPIALGELQTEINNRLGTLGNINVDNLTKVIPANPGLEQLQKTVNDLEINKILGDLTTGITGDKQFGKIGVPSGVKTPFDEFQIFLANAGALPSRVLDALIKVFKKFLDKISNPDEWLGTLSSETLTNLFIEQIQDLENSLPSQAIASIEAKVNRQAKILEDYQQFLAEYDLKNDDREKITQHRSHIKGWTKEIERSNQEIKQIIQKLDTFKIEAFESAVAHLPKSVTENATSSLLLNDIFVPIQNFLNALKARIKDVVNKITELITKLKKIITEAITKVKDITNGIVNKISDTIDKAGGALGKVEQYLKDAIHKLEKFINDACNKSGDVVAPLKNACNSISGTTIQTIDKVANTIDEQANKLKGSLNNFNESMKTKLNPEKLERDIKEFLDKVMNFLNSKTVQDAIKSADDGIKKAVEALKDVSLKPAFKAAINQSESLETKFKGMDVSKMGTAQKVALKVGVTVIKQVDVPKIVNPELNSAFKSVVDPLAGLVTSVQGETEKVYEKIQSFKPGNLVDQWLSPYINSLTDELQKYKPSVLLKDVQQIYLELVDKLDILDPNQLVALLDELYKKLANLIKFLNPESLIAFLAEKKAAFVTMLKEFKKDGILELENKIKDSIGDAEKLLGGLGLDSILKADFWNTLDSILSLNIDDKIKAVDEIKQKTTDKINNIQNEAVQAKLRELQEAIQKYNNNPADAIAKAETSLKESLNIYQEKYKTYQNQWQKSYAAFQEEASRLKILSEPVNYEYHFLNLQETCQTLSNVLQSGISLKESSALSQATDQSSEKQEDKLVEELLKVIETWRKKPKDSTEEKQLVDLTNTLKLRDEVVILEEFKQIIPNELEKQLVKPIKDILEIVKNILVEPKKIIHEVQDFLKFLKDVPTQIAKGLENVVEQLRDILVKAVENLINKVEAFNFDFIQNIYDKIKNTIESLQPSQILNGFFDSSDFQKNPQAFIKVLQERKEEASNVIWDSYLSEQTKKLLNTYTGEGVPKEFLNDMNKLLKSDFYNENFVKNANLSEAAQRLAKKEKDKLQPEEVIRLNRLVLETLFPEYISRSLQSVFPYLKSKLQKLYPQALVNELDKIHTTLIETLQGLPKAIGGALDKKYEELVNLYKTAIQDKIRNIFRALLKKLYELQGELELGLDNLEDAFNNLIAAVPV